MARMDNSIPRPPRLRPTWTTWMWIGFMVAVIVLSLVGFLVNRVP
jgi:quinol-cytochrome oxidoreductase complex cytochrome b subunit